MDFAGNQPIDIDELMARVRADLSARKQQALLRKYDNLAPYAPGTVLRFGIDGNVAPYLEAGWAQAESGFHWTQEEVVGMVFRFAESPGDLVLSITVHPHVGGGIAKQSVVAFWDDVPVGSWSISQASVCHTFIPAHSAEATALHRLRFRLPDAFSPVSKNLSSDIRRLGLAFTELVLQPARAFGFSL